MNKELCIKVGKRNKFVQNYHPTLRKIREERRSRLHGGGSLKPRKILLNFYNCLYIELIFRKSP